MAKVGYQIMQLVPESQPETGTKYLIRVPTRGTKSGNKIRLKNTILSPERMYGL